MSQILEKVKIEEAMAHIKIINFTGKSLFISDYMRNIKTIVLSMVSSENNLKYYFKNNKIMESDDYNEYFKPMCNGILSANNTFITSELVKILDELIAFMKFVIVNDFPIKNFN